MTFQQLLKVSRNNIKNLSEETSYDNIDDNKFNPTNFDQEILHPYHAPFLRQIFFLNYFVFTTASTPYPWNKGGLHKTNGLVISFYVKNEYLDDLKNYCKKYNLEFVKHSYSELARVGKNSGNDFSSLENVSTHVGVYDPSNNKNLYINLINFFAKLYNYEEYDEKDNFYEELERKILEEDPRVVSCMLLVEKLQKYVKVFYHPVYIDYSSFRIGASKEAYEKLQNLTTHTIKICDWKSEEECDFHILLLTNNMSMRSLEALNLVLNIFN
jgi:hypothetical protein